MARVKIEYASTPRRRRFLAAFESKTARRIAVGCGLFLICYVGSYVCLSAYGRFEPSFIGLNGVKAYDWAPAGVVKHYRWRWGIIKFYLPLWYADRMFWHREEAVWRGGYPIHEPKDIGEVYRAWR